MKKKKINPEIVVVLKKRVKRKNTNLASILHKLLELFYERFFQNFT